MIPIIDKKFEFTPKNLNVPFVSSIPMTEMFTVNRILRQILMTNIH